MGVYVDWVGLLNRQPLESQSTRVIAMVCIIMWSHCMWIGIIEHVNWTDSICGQCDTWANIQPGQHTDEYMVCA